MDALQTEENVVPDAIDPYFTESQRISSESGPKSITRNVLQDKSGDFWFATWEGLFHYDGKKFTNYTNKFGLKRHRVFCLLEDRQGVLWFGTIGAGVYSYDGKSFTHFDQDKGLVNNSVQCMYEDDKGFVWFGTQGGISKFKAGEFENFTHADGLTSNDINSIVQDLSLIHI